MNSTISVIPSEVPIPKLHGYLLGAIGPRPIAFASTINESGTPNLSPFSFFNVFSANPPLLIFSPARRVRNNTTKHTLENVLKVPEVVVNIVDYNTVQQMSLSSTEYAAGVNEFKKAGLTMLKSDLVKPYRVEESPVQFECKVTKVEPLGKEGGAGNLIYAEVLKMHIKSYLIDENGSIDPVKIDQVARMGGNWYSRANQGLFEVAKPLSSLGIGIDQIPPAIRNSKILTGNDLGMLGNIEKIPSKEAVAEFLETHIEIRSLVSADDEDMLHKKAQELLKEKKISDAWKVLLAN